MKRRQFIKSATLGSSILPGLFFSLDSCRTVNTPSKLKDNFWLWGQTAGSHHENNAFHLPGVNRMTPKEGCDYLGISKCLRVSMGSFGPIPPFDREAEKIKDLKEVVWSAIGADNRHHNDQSDINEVLRMATLYPHVTGAVLDDFFNEYPGKNSVDSIKAMADKLHNFDKRRLDLWVVWYTHQLDINIDQFLGSMDVITLWTWNGFDLQELDANVRKFIRKTPEKRRLLGVYMWNYGERIPLTVEQMKFQLDRCYYWMKEGSVEGLVFCSNCNADLDLEAVEYTRKWIAETGNERIS